MKYCRFQQKNAKVGSVLSKRISEETENNFGVLFCALDNTKSEDFVRKMFVLENMNPPTKLGHPANSATLAFQNSTHQTRSAEFGG